jgi:CMP-N,N'-diacetyllegionaminic acid synthase
MTVLGVVPARGGSRAIPRKNLALLGGRPLLAWTAAAARASRRLDRVVLSTDDAEIAEAGRGLGLEVPFLRPPALAADETPMVDVLRHVVAALEGEGGRPIDVVVLLQPTSPFRRAEHVDAAVETLLRTGADTVVSVVEVPHQFSPASVMRLDGDRLTPYEGGPMILRRQDKPRVFARNGPAVLAIRRDVVVRKGALYGDDTRAYVMSAEDSIDIDGPDDLDRAAWLLARREGAR